jgi:hypothetical protein
MKRLASRFFSYSDQMLILFDKFDARPSPRPAAILGAPIGGIILGEKSYIPARVTRHARAAAFGVIRDGARAYERARCLPRVLPMLAGNCHGPEPETTRLIVRKLADAIRRERRLGRAGHWAYDLNKHLALTQAWEAESRQAKSWKTKSWKTKTGTAGPLDAEPPQKST